MRKQLFLLALVSIITFSASHAQNSENKWGVGFHFGVMEYHGELEKQFYSFTQGYAVGASLSRYLTPSFDIMGHFFYDRSHSWEDGRTGMPTWMHFEADMFNLNLLMKYKFNNGYILKESAMLSPFILAGLGGNFSITNGEGEHGLMTDQTYFRPTAYGGIGLNFQIVPALALVVQTAIQMPFIDKIDGVAGDVAPNYTKVNDLFMENSAGIYITPGKAKPRDADQDGVNDKLDKCPDTPVGVAVDANGCPLDSDFDGILDYQDECPFVAGLKEFKGCPDTDKDGIQDKLDECPDVFGLAEFKGCPDSDGDGVPDKNDRCPDTPRGTKVDSYGCPLDRDNDGVPDTEDLCPDVPGLKELKGCPMDAKYIIDTYGLLLKPIYYDFDSYKLKLEGIEALDKIASALSNQKDFGVQFDGHCDFIGTEEYNLKLSEKRAYSARDYLINKGVSDSRIRILYYGEANPAADNQTGIGRKLNRRVEYNIYQLGK
jgi:OmpA-OmpF porin, OOP family